ncbi:WXG100 family type VII secretion target [Streptomyces sp. NPDC001985]|uniref:WXG100 family type VII secretion target n=1 Tax=Streptomyces sp. NPDC001985 TaxID=3154406 RepID=UPI00332620B3
MSINADYNGDGFISHGEAMKGSMEALIQAAGNLREILTRLESEIAPTFADWQSEDPTGGAKAVYDDCQRRWNEAITKLQEFLGRAGLGAGDVADIYQGGDRMAAQIMSG